MRRSGYDWGGRAAYVVSALWPDRVKALVSQNGYNIQDIANAMRPSTPEDELRLWYQYYLHGERGRAGLTEHRDAFMRLLWRLWSPTWKFSNEDFDRAAASFANEDFVDVVAHSYRHRFGLVAGDPQYDAIEGALAMQPPISVPTITLDGEEDGVVGARADHSARFCGWHQHRVVRGGGHNLPQEMPAMFADAILQMRALELIE